MASSSVPDSGSPFSRIFGHGFWKSRRDDRSRSGYGGPNISHDFGRDGHILGEVSCSRGCGCVPRHCTSCNGNNHMVEYCWVSWSGFLAMLLVSLVVGGCWLVIEVGCYWSLKLVVEIGFVGR
ncbi:uncharacterized protein LOC131324484 [Rhododendron vialii]|uniref:uncharacterized protein LOC131324484 n=1 Tax=Rhododendron vialii TaxID=182163 RepID=UPI00265E4BB3|nr:uncharacterized protein LOC131324484 [Rhododendron vialii]